MTGLYRVSWPLVGTEIDGINANLELIRLGLAKRGKILTVEVVNYPLSAADLERLQTTLRQAAALLGKSLPHDLSWPMVPTTVAMVNTDFAVFEAAL